MIHVFPCPPNGTPPYNIQNARFEHFSLVPPSRIGVEVTPPGESAAPPAPASSRLAVMRKRMMYFEASVFPEPDSPVIRMDWFLFRILPLTSLPRVSAMYL